MTSFTTSAVILRRIEFGDFDLIISFFTLHKGKISAIAKSAKKSVKRFSGILEPFSNLQVVCSPGRRNVLPVLQEAILQRPFTNIGFDILKTAYASYWAEMVHEFMEEGSPQASVFDLLIQVFAALDAGITPPEFLSILFQLHFMVMAGFSPNLSQCGNCRCPVELFKTPRVQFDLKKGSIVCPRCSSGHLNYISLSISTIKQLLWIEHGDFNKAGRIRLTQQAIGEGQQLLESFVRFHLGKKLRSLAFLQQIRKAV